ncbi:Vacuolar protein sorting-associated protein 20 [Gnomoniopsis sp. IMI 355080]|nr:Vacuolar protein sorting-associated protein 20 [Gnomoniopsis sp. IMI 355080]
MGNNSSRVTAQDKAILDMKTQRDKLHQYQRRIKVLTDRETDIAKQMLAKGDKRRALIALRKKKYQETLLAQTDGQLEQLEKLTANVEFALIQKDVVFGLQQGTKVLNEIHAEMGGLENVEKLMGDSAEAIAYQNEISDMLGGRISNHDEDEIEDELRALEAELKRQEPLPNVPNTPLPEREEEAPQPAQVKQQEPEAMLA